MFGSCDIIYYCLAKKIIQELFYVHLLAEHIVFNLDIHFIHVH